MYYPLEKITPNLHSSGNEFYIGATKKDFTGYYYSTFDGRYFSGNTPTANSTELFKYANSANSSNTTIAAYTYDKLSSTMTTDNPAPTSYKTLPTEQDYKNGYYQRYFTKRVNGDESTIQEVTKEDYESVAGNPLYFRVSLTWYIAGSITDLTSSEVVVYGVLNRNIHTIRLNTKIMAGLDKYLANPLEHYKK